MTSDSDDLETSFNNWVKSFLLAMMFFMMFVFVRKETKILRENPLVLLNDHDQFTCQDWVSNLGCSIDRQALPLRQSDSRVPQKL